MAASIPRTGTEDARNALTIKVGTVADIESVGVYHTLTPAGTGTPPAPADFTTVTLAKPGDPLADGQTIDVVSLVGPRNGDVVLDVGDWQRWVYLKTAREDIIRAVDVLTIS